MRDKCIVCLEKIPRSKVPYTMKVRRGQNDLTCSRKCAKIYNRVQIYLREKITKKIEKKYKLK